MSIQSEITRISGNVSDAFTAITNKGVTVPAGSTSDDLADLISQISGGGGGAISIVDTPDSAGGTVRTITAVDISSDTVTAAHLEQGYTAHDAEGNAITGTLSPGGGGGGLEYETGTYTPASDIARLTIYFENSHTDKPAFIVISDTSSASTSVEYDNVVWSYSNPYGLFGVGFPYDTSNLRGGLIDYAKRTSGNIAAASFVVSVSDTSWVSNASFLAYTQSSLNVWRAGRTYKWAAVWLAIT